MTIVLVVVLYYLTEYIFPTRSIPPEPLAIYVCPVDAEGTFTLTGVAPGARLQGRQVTFQAGAAGSETHVRIE